MRMMATILLLTILAAGLATAADLGPRAPTKGDAHVLANPASDAREGGETIADAVPIPGVPWADSGATCDNIDDYDEVCPYTGSTSPDVVYSLIVEYDSYVDIDLCGSSYDTKVYVYDENMNALACNDDFYFDEICGVYVSRIEFLQLVANAPVYIVIDGYGGDCGEYELMILDAGLECWLDCPPEGVAEGEPELHDDYVDEYNSGCGYPGPGAPLLQDLWGDPAGEFFLCGLSGWYDFEGSEFRDTDWFSVIIGETGVMTASLMPEHRSYLFQIVTDCNNLDILQQASADPCAEAMLTIEGEPGEIVWLWVAPQDFEPPLGFFGHEFDYHLWLSGIEDDVVAREANTWSEVKGLYR